MNSSNPNPQTIVAIIPLYNGKDFIEKSLGSVLRQTRTPDEIVIVDDGSTDDGAANVRKWAESDSRIKIAVQPNGGQSSARNHGVRISTGSLIAFLDQDDWWYPNHLEVLERAFIKSSLSPMGWVYSDLDEYDLSGQLVTRKLLSTIPGEHPKQTLHACLLQDMYVLPSASLISREAFDRVGGFDEHLVGYEDDDLYLRIFRAGYQNRFIRQALSAWRIHGGSASYSPRMFRSAMIYAEKLLEAYPNQRDRVRFYARDIVAPRFFRLALTNYTRNVSQGNKSAAAEALRQIDTLTKSLRDRRKMQMTILRPFIGSYFLMKIATRLKLQKLFGKFL